VYETLYASGILIIGGASWRKNVVPSNNPPRSFIRIELLILAVEGLVAVETSGGCVCAEVPRADCRLIAVILLLDLQALCLFLDYLLAYSRPQVCVYICALIYSSHSLSHHVVALDERQPCHELCCALVQQEIAWPD
jgi:hypothetical protein